jgi:hypothetical protein
MDENRGENNPTTGSSKSLRELAAVSDSDLLLGSATLGSVALNGLDNLHR